MYNSRPPLRAYARTSARTKHFGGCPHAQPVHATAVSCSLVHSIRTAKCTFVCILRVVLNLQPKCTTTHLTSHSQTVAHAKYGTTICRTFFCLSARNFGCRCMGLVSSLLFLGYPSTNRAIHLFCPVFSRTCAYSFGYRTYLSTYDTPRAEPTRAPFFLFSSHPVLFLVSLCVVRAIDLLPFFSLSCRGANRVK